MKKIFMKKKKMEIIWKQTKKIILKMTLKYMT